MDVRNDNWIIWNSYLKPFVDGTRKFSRLKVNDLIETNHGRRDRKALHGYLTLIDRNYVGKLARLASYVYFNIKIISQFHYFHK